MTTNESFKGLLWRTDRKVLESALLMLALQYPEVPELVKKAQAVLDEARLQERKQRNQR